MTSDETGMVAIFQSTLPREERPVRRYSLPLISVNFNPRSHERSDNIQNLTFALTKRFQSTLPREERLGRRAFLMELDEFQSTLPREERQYIHSLLILLTYFNPRSHERSDVLLHVLSYVFDISIHAPTRGATTRDPNVRYTQQFQSTLPREERQ